jgi:rhodanese-related sulfurtransferase
VTPPRRLRSIACWPPPAGASSILDPTAAGLRDEGRRVRRHPASAPAPGPRRIPGALVIDRNVLEWRLDPSSPYRDERVPADRPLVVFCQQGYASSLAVAALVDMGLVAVHDLGGGFVAWRAAGLPTEGASSGES